MATRGRRPKFHPAVLANFRSKLGLLLEEQEANPDRGLSGLIAAQREHIDQYEAGLAAQKRRQQARAVRKALEEAVGA